jgi:RecB family endonuclease NucS
MENMFSKKSEYMSTYINAGDFFDAQDFDNHKPNVFEPIDVNPSHCYHLCEQKQVRLFLLTSVELNLHHNIQIMLDNIYYSLSNILANIITLFAFIYK